MTKGSEKGTWFLAAARLIKNGEIVLTGTGLPIIVGLLAKLNHAPESIIICPGGGIEPSFEEGLPISVAGGNALRGAVRYLDLCETYSLVQSGRVDVGIIGGLQVDKYGNVNSTWLRRENRRFNGSGGANDIASSAKRFLILIAHERRRLVEQVDFVTSPGFLSGPGAREKAGLKGGGPAAIVTTKAVFEFDIETKEAVLVSTLPGEDPETVAKETGFSFRVSSSCKPFTPTAAELESLERVRQLAVRQAKYYPELF